MEPKRCPFLVEYIQGEKVDGACAVFYGVGQDCREILTLKEMAEHRCLSEKHVACEQYAKALLILKLGLPLICPLSSLEEGNYKRCEEVELDEQCPMCEMDVDGGYLQCDIFSKWFWRCKAGITGQTDGKKHTTWLYDLRPHGEPDE